MTRDILNSFSTTMLFVIAVGGTVVLSVVAVLVVGKVFPRLGESAFAELAEAVRVVVELMFVLILAFVIAAVLDRFNQANSTVGSEATALSQLIRENAAFPAAERIRLDDGIKGYLDVAINDEWRTMREGKASPETAAAVSTLYDLYERFTPGPGNQSSYYDQALGQLNALVTARRERLSISNSNLPSVLLLMVIVGAVLLLVIEYRPALGRGAQVGLMAAIALVVSSTTLLPVVLDYPFAGDTSVGTDQLRLGVLSGLPDRARAPQPGDKPLRLTADELSGVWNSTTYGTTVLQSVGGGVVRGVYEEGEDGTVYGVVSPDGVFKGAWCQGPTRKPPDAGWVDWELIRTASQGTVITGRWMYGYLRRLPSGFVMTPVGGWDLQRVRQPAPRRLLARLRSAPASAFCRAS